MADALADIVTDGEQTLVESYSEPWLRDLIYNRYSKPINDKD